MEDSKLMMVESGLDKLSNLINQYKAMNFKLILLTLCLLSSFMAIGQITINNTTTEISLDFDVEVPGAIAENWDGTGIQSTVSPGDLDADFTRLENLSTSTTYGATVGSGTAVTGGVNNNDNPPAKIYCAAYPELNKCLRIKPGEGNNAIGGGSYTHGHGEAIWEFRVEWDYDATPDPSLTIEVASSFHNDNTNTNIHPMKVEWEYRIGTTGTWTQMSTATSNFTNNTVGEMDDYDFFYTIDMDGVALGTDVYFRAVVVDQTGGNYSGGRSPKADSYYICQADLLAVHGPLAAESIDFYPLDICYLSADPIGPLSTYELSFNLYTYGEVNVEDYYVEYSADGVYWFPAIGSVAGSNCTTPCNSSYTNQTVTFIDIASPGTSFSRYFRVYSEDYDGYVKYYLDEIKQDTYAAHNNCTSYSGENEASSSQLNEAFYQQGDKIYLLDKYIDPVDLTVTNSLGQVVSKTTLTGGDELALPNTSQVYYVTIHNDKEVLTLKIFR